jgi:serine/threonine-protein kinase
MTDHPQAGPFSEEAERTFARYLTHLRDGDSLDFEELCSQHPGVADELRRKREIWIEEVARVGTRSSSVTDRIRDLRGESEGLPTIDRTSADDQRASRAVDSDEWIGRYAIEGEVARGGQGAIFLAYDRDLNRQLAMKVILGKGELGGSNVTVADVAPKSLGRFLGEAQVTGQLDHPGIVPVHELGLDGENHLYFTMKLVKGENLGSVYAKVRGGREGWTRTRALNVLVRVCEAMSYAHHKGVIHRDLKPDNVMVGRFGEVYVMDWGLARVLEHEKGVAVDKLRPPSSQFIEMHDADLDDLRTLDGDVVGTPAYMPPEQAEGRISAMGPQSDVYSLGAILYELLAGHAPYIPPDARVNLVEVWTQVREGPPAPLAETTDAPAELVAICEKAMARDPRQRYPDMSGLATDLSAFLEGRVVHAYETGAVAELRKWVRRNRSLAAVMAAGVLALVVGLATTLVQKKRADDNAQLALQREIAAKEAEASARVAETKATEEAIRANVAAETAEQTADFLVGLFEVVDPREARGDTITAREILDKGSRRIETELAGQPQTQSDLMETMGTVYLSLGLYDQSLPLLQQALALRQELHGPEHPQVAESLNALGEVRRMRAEFTEAQVDLEQALELGRRFHGDDDLVTAESMYQLGAVLSAQGQFEEGEPLLRDALAIRRRNLGTHADVAEVLNELALNLLDQGEMEAAGPLFEEALELRQNLLGDHPETAESLNNLGLYRYETGDEDAADLFFEESLTMMRKVYGDVHPEVAIGLNNRAFIHHDKREFDLAEDFYREALSIREALLADGHPDVAQARLNLGILLNDRGRYAQAKGLYFGALESYRAAYEEEHPSVQAAINDVVTFLRENIARLPAGSPEQALEKADLAAVLVSVGNEEDALDLAGEAVELLTEALGTTDWRTARAESVVGAALLGLGDLGDAEGLLENALQLLQDARGNEDRATRQAIGWMAELYDATDRADEATRLRALLAD